MSGRTITSHKIKLILPHPTQLQHDLRDVFLFYDVQNSGTLSPEEFRMAIERKLHIRISDDDLASLVRKFDKGASA